MERPVECRDLLFAVFAGHCRLRLHHVEGVIGAWHNLQFTGHSRVGEPLGVGEVLVVEQVVGATPVQAGAAPVRFS
jgi:hypothetical protein